MKSGVGSQPPDDVPRTGAPPPVEAWPSEGSVLPGPLGPVGDAAAGRTAMEPGAGWAERLSLAAAREGATPFELALGAFVVLLRRLIGHERVALATPRTLRDGANLDRVVGYLLELVPVVADVAPTSTFREVVASLRSCMRDAREPATIGHGRRPLDVVFVFRQDPAECVELDGVDATPIPLEAGRAKYPLTFDVCLRAGRAQCTAEFMPDRVCEEVARTFPARFAALLAWLVDHPDAPVGQAPSLDAEERRRIEAFGAGPDSPCDSATSIHRRFESVVARRAEHPAVIAGSDAWTYRRLDTRANQLARRLLAAGVAPGHHVPLLLRRTPHLIAAALAVLKAGAAFVPLDPDEPAERRRAVLERLDATVLVTEDAIESGFLPTSLEHVRVDDPALDELPGSPLDHDAKPDDPAYVMFTSGSTGRPKGVVVPHRGVLRLVLGQTFARMDETRTWLQLAPPWFDASTLEIWAPLLHGGRCVLFPGSAPDFRLLAAVLAEHRVDSIWLTSSLFNAAVDHDPTILAGVEQLLVGGEVLSPAHLRRARAACPRVRLVNGYGPTENTTFTTCHVIDDADLEEGRAVPIGRPIAATRVHVRDLDGQPTPVGVPGELWAAGSGVALGYLGAEPEEDLAFRPDPADPTGRSKVYRTGDVVRWRPDGTLDFLGRRDRQLKLRGFRVEPEEIERVLARHPGVRSAAVALAAAGSPTAHLVAAYVSAHGEAPDHDDLRRHLEAALPAHLVPARLVSLDRLPITPNGKLDRIAILERLPTEDVVAHRDPTPPTELEQIVQQAWTEVLRLDRVGLDDDYFELGGNSLLAIRLVVRLEALLGRTVPTRLLFAAPTVRRMADALVREAEAGDPPTVVRLRATGDGTPMFCVPGLGGHVFSYRSLLAHLPPKRPVFGLQVQELGESPALGSIEALAGELVRQLRVVRPRPPYILLGYSFGGNLAYEMASQLVGSGVSDVHLLVIDAYPPGAVQPKSGWAKLQVHLRELARRSPREGFRYVAERVKKRLGRTPAIPVGDPNPRDPDLARISAVEESCRRALRTYRPRPFPGVITFFRALRLSAWRFIDPSDPTGGWGRLAPGRVRVFAMDCEHLEVFSSPHIEALARMIEDACRD